MIFISRKRREWFPGAMYHIMNRGGRHQEIFRDEDDYRYFLDLLEAVQVQYGLVVHAYCLMTNHYHLLVSTGEEPIWKCMKVIDQLYSMHFNWRHGLDGPLFRGRYHSIIVKTDPYFIQTSRYIALNPVKAGIVNRPEDYKWSSYKTLVGLADDHITDVTKTWDYFAEPQSVGYRNFIENNNPDPKTEEEIRGKMGENKLWLPNE